MSTQVVKFIDKETVQTTERRFVEELEVPQIVFCAKYPFKTDAVKKMGLSGLRDNFLLAQPWNYGTMENMNITNLNDVWENGTVSMDELSIGWNFYNG